MKGNGQGRHPARRGGLHVFDDAKMSPGKVKSITLRNDAHQSHHAGTKCCCYKIGWGKTASIPLVVGWSHSL
jgi:hypothetical protein